MSGLPDSTSASTTWSSRPRRIPITPRAVRPIGRTSFSLKRIDFPFEVAMKISSDPRDSSAASRWSPSSMVTAMMPPARGRENAASGVFLM